MNRVLLVIASLLAVGFTTRASADDWPQWRGPTRDGVWRETGIVESFKSPSLEPVWRMPIGPGYSGPTVSQNRVFVTDRQTKPSQIERVLAFAADTGAPLWTHAYECVYKNVGYEAGPRASVSVDGDKAYALGAMGHCCCLNVADGSVIWQRDLNADYSIDMPIWGISAARWWTGHGSLCTLAARPGPASSLSTSSQDLNSGVRLDERGQYTAPDYS